MKILVTGGCGYIGSHTCVALLEAGHELMVLDNLSNSSSESLNRIDKICGRMPAFLQGDIRNCNLLAQLFDEHGFDAVFHFSGLKAVGESVSQPLKYYENNVAGSLALLEAMVQANVFKLVFSSSATVYGDPVVMPIREDFSTDSPANPYGRSKLMVENILSDLANSDSRWGIAILRYFNPVGAHKSGLIGEDPNGIPNNLFPYISQVATGSRETLSIFGSDYPTVDGTGVRDYIHVNDLVRGHVLALNALEQLKGTNIWNLGTGSGHSVLQVLAAFIKATGIPVPYKIASRRSGDVAECWADPSKAERELGWRAEYGLEEMVVDSLRWQTLNPNGYGRSI